MAHHHSYSLTFLKTPLGYLTNKGFTNNINDENIVTLRSNTYGVWSSLKRIIDYFINASENPSEIRKQLEKYSIDGSNFEVVSYYCGQNYCEGCYEKKERCVFWNGDRNSLNLLRHHGL